jgi:hypothetical protein
VESRALLVKVLISISILKMSKELKGFGDISSQMESLLSLLEEEELLLSQL